MSAEQTKEQVLAHKRRNSRERNEVLPSGFRLESDLTIVDHLGGSRKVDIYLCRSERHKGLVACKVLRPKYRIDFSALEAVLQEGQLLCLLSHPNVVEGYDVELQDHPRIAMQYLPGQTLANTFFQGNYEAFEVRDIIDVVDQLGEALSYIHEQGIVHLDVKPSNVMYESGHVTLFDFSVAEEFSPERTLKDNAGTVEYMAPEQTYRQEVGYATDVFGLGVLFYQLLTGGKLPYPVVERPLPTNEKEIRRQPYYEVSPIPPSASNSEVPRSVEAVAMKAIEPEARMRYQTPSDFRAALLESI